MVKRHTVLRVEEKVLQHVGLLQNIANDMETVMTLVRLFIVTSKSLIDADERIVCLMRHLTIFVTMKHNRIKTPVAWMIELRAKWLAN